MAEATLLFKETEPQQRLCVPSSKSPRSNGQECTACSPGSDKNGDDFKGGQRDRSNNLDGKFRKPAAKGRSATETRSGRGKRSWCQAASASSSSKGSGLVRPRR